MRQSGPPAPSWRCGPGRVKQESLPCIFKPDKSPHVHAGRRTGGFNERAAALRKLTRTLPADDAKALTMFLDFRAGEQDPQSRLATLEFEGLTNDALVILLAQKDLPTGAGRPTGQHVPGRGA